MNDEIMVQNQGFLAPAADINTAINRYQAMQQFVGKIMKKDTDYGVIPGAGNKPTLLKPGAEKLSTFFGLTCKFVLIEAIQDWTGEDHGGEPLFSYWYAAEMYKGDYLVGTGEGSCNSWEKKYRYRAADIVCPTCGKAGTIIKGKAEYGGGWLCFAKKGGCGDKWGDGSPVIEGQQRGEIPNPNPADLINTLQKMAQKRALVAAVLITTNASEYFTQDIEDMDFGGVVIDVVPQEPARNASATDSPQTQARSGQTQRQERQKAESNLHPQPHLHQDDLDLIKYYLDNQWQGFPANWKDYTAYYTIAKSLGVEQKDAAGLLQDYQGHAQAAAAVLIEAANNDGVQDPANQD